MVMPTYGHSRAGLAGLAGRMRPAGRQLDNAGIGVIKIVIVITLTLILTLKPDLYHNPNHNPNPTYPNKPTEPYQTLLTLTDTVDLQFAPSDRHTNPAFNHAFQAIET